MQLVQEYRLQLLLLLGRSRCHSQPAAVSMSVTRLVQYRGQDGSIKEWQVGLMLPAIERTIVRLMQAWWERKVGASNIRQCC